MKLQFNFSKENKLVNPKIAVEIPLCKGNTQEQRNKNFKPELG